MTLTIYVPDAGGINGGGMMADGTAPKIGYVACGSQYKFGTVFQILADEMPYGLPNVFECRDRGSMVGNRNLDMVLKSGNVQQDLQSARQWGKRKLPVRVWANWYEYNSGEAQDERMADTETD